MKDINLMPWRQALARQQKQLMLSEILLGLLLAVLCAWGTRWLVLACHANLQAKISLLQQRLAIINNKLAKAPTLLAAPAAAPATPRMNLVALLTTQHQLIVRLQRLALLLPPAASLRAITITPHHWRLEGSTTNLRQLWAYVAAIAQQLQHFVDVKVTNEQQQFQFALTIHLNSASPNY